MSLEPDSCKLQHFIQPLLTSRFQDSSQRWRVTYHYYFHSHCVATATHWAAPSFQRVGNCNPLYTLKWRATRPWWTYLYLPQFICCFFLATILYSLQKGIKNFHSADWITPVDSIVVLKTSAFLAVSIKNDEILQLTISTTVLEKMMTFKTVSVLVQVVKDRNVCRSGHHFSQLYWPLCLHFSRLVTPASHAIYTKQQKIPHHLGSINIYFIYPNISILSILINFPISLTLNFKKLRLSKNSVWNQITFIRDIESCHFSELWFPCL